MLTLFTFLFERVVMKYVLLSLLLAATTVPAAAQTPVPGPECAKFIGSGNPSEAAAAAKGEEPALRKRVAQNPRDVEGRVALARLLSQCLLPSAELMQRGELSAEAIELLDDAIRLQPDHWLARFVLATIADQSPAFLGRGKRAAQEYDELLRIQGNRTDNPMFARVFAQRGRQLSRLGEVDSARALWARGLALFPEDADLAKLVAGATASPAPSSQPAARDSSAPSAGAAAALAIVQVTASAAPKVISTPVKSVSRSEILLTAGGTADIFQAVQLQPGATRMNEGGDVYTRGGDASETAVVVNDGRMISLGRFEGLNGSMFGALDPFIMKSVRFWSGGFSARHGNVLSGVLEMETDGRPREQQKRIGLSLVQAGGTFRSPLASNAGGWITARASHTGALLRTHGRTDEFDGSPHSVELAGSFVVNPSPLTEVSATGIVASDRSGRIISAGGWNGSFDSEGDTRSVILRSRWISSRTPLVVRGNVTANTRSSEWKFGVLSRERDEMNATVRVDGEWEPTSGTIVRAGVEHGVRSRADRGTVPTTSSVAPGSAVLNIDEERDNAVHSGSYIEAEKPVAGLFVTAGLRADRLPGESRLTLDPRVALSWRQGEWTARVSGGLFHQGRWRGDAAIPERGKPSGLPGLARHAGAGIERARETSLFRAEAFVKGYGDYEEYGVGPVIVSGQSRGAEFLAQKSVGRLNGWVGYSLLDAFSTLENNERVRSAFDITHSFTTSLTATVARNWSVGTTARYGTGAPHTPVVGVTTVANSRIEPVYGRLMSERLPDYRRLDARVMRYFQARTFLLATFAEVLNVTGRRNISSVAYDSSYSSREDVPAFFSRRTFVFGGEVTLR
jgi:tetratricopeptide (TPR) repeat protein